MFGYYNIKDLYLCTIVQIKNVRNLDNSLLGKMGVTVEPIEYGIFTKSKKIGVDFERVTTGEIFQTCNASSKIGDYSVFNRSIKKLKDCLKTYFRKKILSKRDIKALEFRINYHIKYHSMYHSMFKNDEEHEKLYDL